MAERKILGTTGKIRFDVTQEHRTGGNGATYILANYKKAVEHPDFQQAIKMGNAYGYHGHPRRQVLENGKLTYKPVLFPHETEATPTHVCTYAAMDGKHCIHEQAFLDTIPGKNVFGLWEGKTGGFSSRASTIGGYGGRFYPTKLARMAGMDFVHDRSYRYNSFEGVLATESVMHEMSIEYLIDDLGIGDKAAHFICNGGVCPRPEDLALEQAMFFERMEYELALEEAYKQEILDSHKRGYEESEIATEETHKVAVESAYKKGFEENLENEKNAFRSEIEEFQENYAENRNNELIKAEGIAIECVNRMPRKPYFEDKFYTAIAPALIRDGTEQIAIESALYDILGPLVGYKPADFAEPKEEFVNVSASKIERPAVFNPKDSFLNPYT